MASPPTVMQNPELEPDIGELLDAGKSAAAVAHELAVPINDVLIVVAKRRHPSTAPQASPPRPRPPLAAVPSERPTVTTPPPTSNLDLISRAKASGASRIVRLAEKAEADLAALRAALTEHEAQAEARAKVDRLKAELAAAQEALRPRKQSAAAKPDTKAIRAWARQNGHTVPDRGTLPAAVVDAYTEAHPA